MDYKEWIQNNVDDNGYGKCHEISEKMSKDFIELTIVKGFYYCPIWGKRMHGWCVDRGGVIVDPTKRQFPSNCCGEYEEVSQHDRPTGKCFDCGELTYNESNPSFCNDECLRNYNKFLLE